MKTKKIIGIVGIIVVMIVVSFLLLQANKADNEAEKAFLGEWVCEDLEFALKINPDYTAEITYAGQETVICKWNSKKGNGQIENIDEYQITWNIDMKEDFLYVIYRPIKNGQVQDASAFTCDRVK